jgi:hypothetical protein
MTIIYIISKNNYVIFTKVIGVMNLNSKNYINYINLICISLLIILMIANDTILKDSLSRIIVSILVVILGIFLFIINLREIIKKFSCQ